MAIHHLPRLSVREPLTSGARVTLRDTQAHKLRHVLRLGQGDYVRLFEAGSGEWRARLAFQGKQGVVAELLECLRPPAPALPDRQLLIPPLKRDAFEWCIEEVVELGVTHIRPILTDQADVRALNPERMADIIEAAAEQSERLDVPTLYPLIPWQKAVSALPSGTQIFAALERSEAGFFRPLYCDGPQAFLVGPAGGWSFDERASLLAMPMVRPVSLGPRILRAETACLVMLSLTLGSAEAQG